MKDLRVNLKNIQRIQVISELKSDEAHIWSACLPDNKKNISYFTSILSEDEHRRVNNYKFSKDSANFIISRGILRCLLGKYLRQDPQQIEIVYGLWGKPCLVGHPLYFNLSHSRDYVLYALAKSYEVGIDIEYIDSSLDLEEMALNIFSPQELAFWKSTKPEEKLNTFFKLWACKEAFLKTFGKGWLNDQHEITPTKLGLLKNGNMNSETNKKMTTPYCFESFPSYASALFVDGPFLEPNYYTVDSLISTS